MIEDININLITSLINQTSIPTRTFSVVGEGVPINLGLQGHTSVSDANLFLKAGQEEHFLRAAKHLAVALVAPF